MHNDLIYCVVRISNTYRQALSTTATEFNNVCGKYYACFQGHGKFSLKLTTARSDTKSPTDSCWTTVKWLHRECDLLHVLALGRVGRGRMSAIVRWVSSHARCLGRLQWYYCSVGNYCYFSMSPRYYSHSFTIPTVIFSITVAITIVTVLLLHSPLSCHSLILMSLLFSELW